MQQLALLFWRICLLKKGPQDVPSAGILLAILLFLSLILDMFSFRLTSSESELFNNLIVIIIYSGLILATTAILLNLLGYKQRTLQTLNALFGAGLVIALCSFPVLIALYGRFDEPGALGLVLLILQFWHLFVMAHILRHALSVSFILGGMLSFAYMMMGFQIMALFSDKVS